MIKSLAGVTAAAVIAGSLATSADALTYTFVSAVSGGGVTGYIETDGTFGSLSTANIVDWYFEMDDGTDTFTLYGDGSVNDNSETQVVGTGFVADATGITFDFSGTGYAAFQSNFIGSGEQFLCFAGDLCGVYSNAVNYLTGTDFIPDTVTTAQRGIVTVATVSAVPLPAGLPLALAGFGLLGLIGRRQRGA